MQKGWTKISSSFPSGKKGLGGADIPLILKKKNEKKRKEEDYVVASATGEARQRGNKTQKESRRKG